MKQNDPARGPKPDSVKIDMDWQDAIGKALKKPKPEGGWPEPDERPGKDKEKE